MQDLTTYIKNVMNVVYHKKWNRRDIFPSLKYDSDIEETMGIPQPYLDKLIFTIDPSHIL